MVRFSQKKYGEEVEPKNKKRRGPSMAYMITTGLLASFAPTRVILRAHKKRIVNHAKREQSTVKQVPVLFLHGFRGSDYTTNAMIKSATAAKNDAGFLKVTADLWGNITLEGNWTGDAHPLVQVVFRERIVGVYGISYYLHHLLPLLAKIYGFDRYDAVAHSMAAPCLIRNQMQHFHEKKMPRLRKAILIAGPFDGVMFLGDLPNVNQLKDNGRPVLMSPTYLSMLWHKRRLPKDLELINIYGNIMDATNSDKFISVVSAKSARYLLASQCRYYEEIEMRGEVAEHSEMHDSPLVLQIINDFMGLKKE